MQMLDIDYDLIFGISDHAGNAEENSPNNHILELSKLTDDSTSSPQEIGERMKNDPMEGEHLDSKTLMEGEHAFEGENERDNDDVEGERLIANVEEELLQNNENYHDVSDVCSIACSDNDELYEDAPLDFDPAYPPMDKWTKDHPKKQIIDFHEDTKRIMLKVLGRESTSIKSPKKLPVIEVVPIQPEIVVVDTPSTQKEIIPSKTGVFRRIKMKSKHKSRLPLGVILRDIFAPASPSSKKKRAPNGQTHIDKKKGRVIISSESTADENETILETPEADHQKDSSHIVTT
ncbi:unnamed protein product [Lactuca saligna]|uniref:Uncharacterized protein n=1 Tax=Lactuca saligna TaxID=75948 RepID=A0AA35ZLG2_LACSI|nr:unnamed protein product [Lactuca saligna]